MSYDPAYILAFWSPDESDKRSPEELYELFVARQWVDGVPELPVEAFLAKLIQAFPAALFEYGDTEWVDWRSEDGWSSFRIEWTPQCAWALLRPYDRDRATRIIDVAKEFVSAWYVPHIDGPIGFRS